MEGRALYAKSAKRINVTPGSPNRSIGGTGERQVSAERAELSTLALIARPLCGSHQD